MAGTLAGGQKAAIKNQERDPDFYRKIGQKGGRNGRTGGFAANRELASIAGAKGGRKSRRNYRDKFLDGLSPEDRPVYVDKFKAGDELLWIKSPYLAIQVTFIRYVYHESIARSTLVQRNDRKCPTEVLESSLQFK